MKGVEFIGVYDEGGIRDAVRGIAIYHNNKSEIWGGGCLVVFFLGGTIWKRPGRKNILEKVCLEFEKDAVIIQRSQRIRFRVMKILDIEVPVKGLEERIKDHKEYIIWRKQQ